MKLIDIVMTPITAILSISMPKRLRIPVEYAATVPIPISESNIFLVLKFNQFISCFLHFPLERCGVGLIFVEYDGCLLVNKTPYRALRFPVNSPSADVIDIFGIGRHQIKFRSDVKWYEITDRNLYMNRRSFLKQTGRLAALTTAGLLLEPFVKQAWPEENQNGFGTIIKSPFSIDDEPNTYRDVSSYNNFYEFGLQKSDPARNASQFKARPWALSIEGLVRKPETIDVDVLIRRHTLEERIYRQRCVEAWSMVVPWIGIPLANLIKHVEPLSAAKYVEFVTLFDPKRMPGQKSPVISWPYVEGLRLDEAMNPLSILAVGLYGDVLPNQNGAPIRLVVPWKYGFKSIKSIVKLRFVEEQPQTSWNILAPHEYGFYANVNPDVDHPRWSQRTERLVGALGRRRTLLYNGYGEYVSHLYKNMDLHSFF